MTTHLPNIDSPEALRRLDAEFLPGLADEVRDFLIQSVSETGGHLGANLGTVELTLALHYVLDTPEDRLVWDVGHQAYTHKILTGRRADFPTLRQLDGLGAFPSRGESPYDTFGVGHAATSISAALGMAQAAALRRPERRVVAVIGDGAMTAGMAFEALNHAGHLAPNLLVILNDNEMSISPNVGGLSKYFSRLISGSLYNRMRDNTERALKRLPAMQDFARRAEEHFKGFLTPGTLFEELGLNYVGPVDGHDLDTLVPMLGRVTRMDGPRLLHVVTRKGKGYTPAEDEPCNYHGVPPFDPESGQRASAGSGAPTFTQVFSDAICELGEQNPDLVAITPAMREGSGLVAFEQRFPERFYDVGIAEQHAVTYAAGLACDGLRPVVAIYSTFLQRAYDQLIHDVALQGLPVTFAIDRAGVVGPDGPTHAGAFDLAFLRCIPELTVMVPSDEAEQRAMLATATALAGPAAVRYPRDRGSGADTTDSLRPLPVGRGRQLRWGTGDSAILVFGPFTGPALAAAADQDASVADMRFVAPLDRDLLAELANRHTRLITVEDNTVRGGAGSAVREALGELGLAGQAEVVTLGLPDRFTDQGARGELLARYGLDADGLRHALAHGRPPVAGQPETP